jgi:hypothetical protein
MLCGRAKWRYARPATAGPSALGAETAETTDDPNPAACFRDERQSPVASPAPIANAMSSARSGCRRRVRDVLHGATCLDPGSARLARGAITGAGRPVEPRDVHPSCPPRSRCRTAAASRQVSVSTADRRLFVRLQQRLRSVSRFSATSRRSARLSRRVPQPATFGVDVTGSVEGRCAVTSTTPGRPAASLAMTPLRRQAGHQKTATPPIAPCVNARRGVRRSVTHCGQPGEEAPGRPGLRAGRKNRSKDSERTSRRAPRGDL